MPWFLPKWLESAPFSPISHTQFQLSHIYYIPHWQSIPTHYLHFYLSLSLSLHTYIQLSLATGPGSPLFLLILSTLHTFCFIRNQFLIPHLLPPPHPYPYSTTNSHLPPSVMIYRRPCFNPFFFYQFFFPQLTRNHFYSLSPILAFLHFFFYFIPHSSDLCTHTHPLSYH